MVVSQVVSLDPSGLLYMGFSKVKGLRNSVTNFKDTNEDINIYEHYLFGIAFSKLFTENITIRFESTTSR